MKTTPSGGAPFSGDNMARMSLVAMGRSQALVLVQNQTPDCRDIEDHIVNDSQVCVSVCVCI